MSLIEVSTACIYTWRFVEEGRCEAVPFPGQSQNTASPLTPKAVAGSSRVPSAKLISLDEAVISAMLDSLYNHILRVVRGRVAVQILASFLLPEAIFQS